MTERQPLPPFNDSERKVKAIRDAILQNLASCEMPQTRFGKAQRLAEYVVTEFYDEQA